MGNNRERTKLAEDKGRPFCQSPVRNKNQTKIGKGFWTTNISRIADDRRLGSILSNILKYNDMVIH